jgi:hypothetical protein
MNSVNHKQKAIVYELFIRKVFNCERGRIRGADRKYMIQLFLNECTQEKCNARIPPERQFYKVKLYIQNAVIKLMKRKKYRNSNNTFSPMFVKLGKATSPNDLMDIVNISFKTMNQLENLSKESA